MYEIHYEEILKGKIWVLKMIEYIIGGLIGFTVAAYLLNVWHEVKLYKEAKELLTKPCLLCDGTGLLPNKRR